MIVVVRGRKNVIVLWNPMPIMSEIPVLAFVLYQFVSNPETHKFGRIHTFLSINIHSLPDQRDSVPLRT